MLRIFKPREKIGSRAGSHQAGCLSRFCRTIANRAVLRMQLWERQMTILQKRTALLCFTLCMGTFFMHMVISGVVRNPSHDIVTRQPLRPPPALALPDSVTGEVNQFPHE